MGVHEAYHRSAANRALHWAFIPLELWAVIKLLSCVGLGPLGDAALVAIVVVAPIYLVTEPLLGALMVLFLVAARGLALRFMASSPAWGGLIAAAVFAVTFAAQLRLGHGVFEGGRDDTDKNLAELGKTRNPVPILLVFYYHLVEIALAAGYRPALARDIRRFTEAELAALAPSTDRAPGSP
ncbi:MAG TPA: hypothetical protein VLT33_07620 [Labilithrix sp.]|nr:hypothetical protein [Labilithrix sp.]